MKSFSETPKKVKKAVNRTSRNSLNKYLGSYRATATAACSFMALQQAQGDIIFTPSGAFAHGSNVDVFVDFDGFNGPEFFIGGTTTEYLQLGPGSDGGTQKGAIEGVLTGIPAGSSVTDPVALPSGYQVGPALFPTFFDTVELSNAFDNETLDASFTSGNFANYRGVERFLGVTFELDRNRHLWLDRAHHG